jgi:L-fuconolactonase
MTTTPVIDSHQHFWVDPTPEQYPWMTGDLTPLARTYGPSDLRPLLDDNGVNATITVQSRSGVDETKKLLDIARATDFVVGVVGWIDLTGSDVAEQLDELRKAPGGHLLVGIRHQVHDEPDPRWLTRRDVQRGLQAVESAGLVYDLLLKEPQLEAGLATARAFPDLRFVLDHIAKPRIAAGPNDSGWERGMAQFSDLPNVACKLSGMVTEADWRNWQTEDLAPYVDKVVRWFGSDRLLFGSDWPVCTLAADYDRVIRTLRDLLVELPDSARDGIFGGNAAQAYRLEMSG